jgi:pentatricopeptide repeat protein
MWRSLIASVRVPRACEPRALIWQFLLTQQRGVTQHAQQKHWQQNQRLMHDVSALKEGERWRELAPVLEAARKTGLLPSVGVYSKAISILARARQFGLAVELFQQMQSEGTKPDEVVYNSLIDACAKSGNSQRALAFLQDMAAAGVTPSDRTYNTAINACAKAGKAETALALLTEMEAAGLSPNLHSYTAAMDACNKCFKFQQALELFAELQATGQSPDVQAFTAALYAHSESGQYEQALDLLSAMTSTDGLRLTLRCYTVGLNACKHTGNWQRAVQLLQQLRADGYTPDFPVYTAALDTLHTAQRKREADALYAELLSSGLVQHWSTVPQTAGMLDLHGYHIGMAVAAMRLVLRDMCSSSSSSSSNSSSSSSSSTSQQQHVHNPAQDLHIITGHAAYREGKDGSVVQSSVMLLLRKRGIVCTVNASNQGRLLVRSAQLQSYVLKQQALQQQHAQKLQQKQQQQQQQEQ